MLITDTPLQNNLKELFALLNFICTEIFVNYEDLDSFLHKDDSRTEAEEERARRLLRPYIKSFDPSSFVASSGCGEESFAKYVRPLFGFLFTDFSQRKRSIYTSD